MAELTLPANAALVVIDVQRAFDDPRMGPRNNPALEGNVRALLARWRESRRPLFHVKHMSTEPQSLLRPGLPGNEFKPEAAPLAGERVIEKNVNSAFIGTPLEAELREKRIDTLVLLGIQTNHCVSTTTRMAGNLGFRAFLVGDACATFDRKGPDGRLWPAQTLHDVSLADLHGEFATVVTTAQVLAAAR